MYILRESNLDEKLPSIARTHSKKHSNNGAPTCGPTMCSKKTTSFPTTSIFTRKDSSDVCFTAEWYLISKLA